MWRELPLGADPAADWRGEVDELGRPVYVSRNGIRYQVQEPVTKERKPLAEALAGATPGGVVSGAWDMAKGLVGGMRDAATAPGRALAGEPVTNGQVMDLAGMVQLGGAAMPAPEGALRSGAVRVAEDTQAQQVARMLRDGRAAEVTDDLMARVDPQEMHALYTSGATGAEMPMDTASRMARARDMGFDAHLYHETGKDFGAFDTGVLGARATDSDLPNGVFLKPDGRSIGLGGDGEIQMPVLARMGKTEDLIDRRHAGAFFAPSDEYRTARMGADNYDTQMARDYDARFEGPAGQEWLNRDGDNYFAEADKFLDEWNAGNVDRASAARSAADDFLTREGVDALRIAQDQGSLGRSVQTTIIRDPANIRSRFARFDPRLSHLSNLSASNASPMVGLYSAQASADEKRRIEEYLRSRQ